MRCFDQVIANVPTKELPKEADARARKEGKGKSKNGQKPASLGIFTIKFHYLGDYVSSIRKRGTTDSYSTETVSTLPWHYSRLTADTNLRQGELAHRLPKSWYGRTDRRDFKGQMTQIERRQARLSQICTALEPSDSKAQAKGNSGHRHDFFPDRRYSLGASQGEPLSLSLFSIVPGTTDSDKHLAVRSLTV